MDVDPCSWIGATIDVFIELGDRESSLVRVEGDLGATEQGLRLCSLVGAWDLGSGNEEVLDGSGTTRGDFQDGKAETSIWSEE